MNPTVLTVHPCGIAEARRWVQAHHSHHHAPRSGLLAVAVHRGEDRVCVGVAGRPVARLLDDGTTAEVTRVASVGGDAARHAASMALGALVRALTALGYRRVVSYTILGESGTSYRAAGWWPVALTRGGEWAREDRPRDGAAQPGRKVRWEHGPAALPRDAEVDAQVRAAVGAVEIPTRREVKGLFGDAR